MRNLGALAVVLLLLVVSMLEHVVAYGYFLVQTCGTGEGAISFPANASWQGWACGAYVGDDWAVPGIWALGASTVLAVAAAGWVWSRGGVWPWASPLALVALPLLTTLLLTLPPDTCSSDQRAEHGAVECRTTPGG